MHHAGTPRRRSLQVSQGFEVSRLEAGLLAAAYERAVPPLTRRTRSPSPRVAASDHERPTFSQTESSPRLASGGHVR
jgi:hypothetical protein